MATEVWISTLDEPDRTSLEPSWLFAGRLDQSRETDLWRVVQGYLGLRSSSTLRSVEFYADLEPDSDGHRALLAALPADAAARLDGSHLRFWIALRWDGPPPRTFFAVEPAELAHLARRPPQPHPGLRPRPVPLGIRLTAPSRGEFFGNTRTPAP